MAGAVDAYKEAFASYKKNPIEYAKFSFILGVLATLVGLAAFVAFLVITVLFFGSIASFSATISNFSIGIVGVAGIFLVLAVGMLVIIWVQMGLTGAYLETMNMLLAGKKQTAGGFFAAIPRRSTPLTIIAIVNAVIVSVPLILSLILAIVIFGGQFFSLLPMLVVLAGLALSALLAMFLAFAMPASVVDGRDPVDSVRHSFSIGTRNFLSLIAYYAISVVLMLPMLFPGLGAIYAVLFAAPLMNGALIVMYKKAR